MISKIKIEVENRLGKIFNSLIRKQTSSDWEKIPAYVSVKCRSSHPHRPF